MPLGRWHNLYYTKLNEKRYIVGVVTTPYFIKTKDIKNKSKWLTMTVHHAKNLNAHIGYTKRNMYSYFHDH